MGICLEFQLNKGLTLLDIALFIKNSYKTHLFSNDSRPKVSKKSRN